MNVSVPANSSRSYTVNAEKVRVVLECANVFTARYQSRKITGIKAGFSITKNDRDVVIENNNAFDIDVTITES